MGDLLTPALGQQRHVFRPIVRLHPDAAHFRLHFALPVRSHSTAGAITKGFRAGHRAGHTGGMEYALPAHLAVPHRPLDHMFDNGQEFAQHG